MLNRLRQRSSLIARGTLALLLGAWLSLALQPCAMAMEEADAAAMHPGMTGCMDCTQHGGEEEGPDGAAPAPHPPCHLSDCLSMEDGVRPADSAKALLSPSFSPQPPPLLLQRAPAVPTAAIVAAAAAPTAPAASGPPLIHRFCTLLI